MAEPLWFIEYPVSFISIFVAVFFTLIYLKNFNRMEHKSKQAHGWEPKITILIPAYNEENSIAACLDSVLASDYPREKMEILVLDDGSTDKTAEIAKRYSTHGVIVCSKENTGKADSLNFGIKKSTGEIIATLDADSFISPYSIRRMLPLFEDETVGAVASAVKVKKAKNLLEEIQRIEYLFALFSRKVVSFIESVQVTPGPFSMFRRWIFDKVGDFDTKSLVEDQEIALRIQSHHYKIRCSLDADVFTEIPRTFLDLMKQRTRWQRGGFWNSLKYLKMINPKYGDLGMIILPFGVFGYLMLVIFLVLAVYYMFYGSPYQEALSYDSYLLAFRELHVFGILMIGLAFLWLFYGMGRLFREQELHPVSIFLYIILYPMLITLFWFSAAYKELRGEGFSW
ncbi:MAG: glycosyltransferase [Candidatus Micrarchaeota archaeon]